MISRSVIYMVVVHLNMYRLMYSYSALHLISCTNRVINCTPRYMRRFQCMTVNLCFNKCTDSSTVTIYFMYICTDYCGVTFCMVLYKYMCSIIFAGNLN